MSAETQEALHAALRGYIPGTDAGLEELHDAAVAHAAEARPMEQVRDEYLPLTEPGASADPVVVAELAEELHAVRAANAILAGQLPGQPPTVITEG